MRNVKLIRAIPIVLLLLLFAANLQMALNIKPEVQYLDFLGFGIIYFVLAILLIARIRFGVVLGLIVPVIILFVYPIIADFKFLHPWSAGVLSAINGLVILGCFIQILLPVEKSRTC